MKALVVIALMVALVFAFGCATQQTAPEQAKKPEPVTGMAGDPVRGKALFEDPKLGGGTSGVSCASCHPKGKGLQGVMKKTEFRAMGKKYTSIEAINNYFIETAQHGKALDPKSKDMQDLVAYLRTL